MLFKTDKYAKKIAVLASVWISVLALPALARAESYPSRPIRIVVPFQAGGTMDLVSRTIADPLKKELGVPVEIDNRPGAATVLGAQNVLASPADGYTLYLGLTSSLINTLKPSPPINIQRDFVPVIKILENPLALYINSKIPVRTGPEFLQWLKQNSGKVNYASPGASSTPHLALLKFSKSHGLDIESIYYKGGTPENVKAVFTGEADFGMDPLVGVKPYADSKQITLIAQTSLTPNSEYGGLPDLKEAGLPELANVTWAGLFARSGTSDEIVQKINAAVAKVIQENQTVRDAIRKFGTPIASVGGPSSDFKAQIDRELSMYANTIKEAGVVLE